MFSGYTESEFKKHVQICRDHITRGDCMQVVLSQRLSVPYQAHPLDLYRALRMLNPSPYMFYLNLDDSLRGRFPLRKSWFVSIAAK